MSAEQGTERRPCPFCGEPVLAAARKCRHCHDWIDPRGALEGRSVWRGDRLAVRLGASLPARACWVCAEDAAGVALRPRSFTHTPRVVYWLLLAGFLPGLVAAVAFQKSAALAIPVCAPCWRGWKLSEVAYNAFTIVGMLFLPAMGGFLASQVHGHGDLVPAGFGIGVAAWLSGVIALRLLVVPRLQITASEIDAELVTLRFPDPGLVRAALDEERRR